MQPNGKVNNIDEKTKAKAIEIGEFFIQNKDKCTLRMAAQHFGISEPYAIKLMDLLQYINKRLYIRARYVYSPDLKKRRRALLLGRYIVKNKCMLKEAAAHFGIREDDSTKVIKYLEKVYPRLHDKVRKTFDPKVKKGLNTKALSQCIVDNRFSVQEALDFLKLNITEKYARVLLWELKDTNPEQFGKLLNVLNENDKNLLDKKLEQDIKPRTYPKNILERMYKVANLILAGESASSAARILMVTHDTVLKDIARLFDVDQELFNQVNDARVRRPENIEMDRPIEVALYLLLNQSSVDQTAEDLGYPLTTVHNDIERLKYIDEDLYKKCRLVIERTKIGLPHKNRKILQERALKGEVTSRVNLEQAIEVGNYIWETHATIDETAKKFNISSSTVYKHIARLKRIDPDLYNRAKTVAFENLFAFQQKLAIGYSR